MFSDIMMGKPKVMVLWGNGLNCEYESGYSFGKAGAYTERVHVNDLKKNPKLLHEYDCMFPVGGFSYGDHIDSGIVLAKDLKYRAMEDTEKFMDDGKLILGVCNGFQVLVKLGLLPGTGGGLKRKVTLTNNDSNRFRDDWVYLKFDQESPCVFTGGVEEMYLPVRHGEGKFIATDNVLKELNEKNLITARYVDEDGRPANGIWPYNPNASMEDIAGICDPTGRIFGLMPHPEAFNDFTNHPRWTRIKRELKRVGKSIPEEGNGIKIFRNAVKYMKENL
jgi:phosphoribosylformylglycinamidine synthase I